MCIRFAQGSQDDGFTCLARATEAAPASASGFRRPRSGFSAHLSTARSCRVGSFSRPGGQRDEMVAGELSHLARKMHAAIGQQDLGFADTAGIEDDLAGRRIAGGVLVGDAEVEITERHPDALAAPAHMDGRLSNGIALRKAAQVFGASCSSKRAWNVKSPAWMISWLIQGYP